MSDIHEESKDSGGVLSDGGRTCPMVIPTGRIKSQEREGVAVAAEKDLTILTVHNRQTKGGIKRGKMADET